MTNNTLISEIIKIFQVKPESGEKVPAPIPVIDVTPQNVMAYLDTSGTIYTVPVKGRFFLNVAEISFYKSGADTGTLIRLDVTPIANNEKSARICHIADITSVERVGQKVVTGLKLELKPGSTISGAISGTFSNKNYTIYGTYYPE